MLYLAPYAPSRGIDLPYVNLTIISPNDIKLNYTLCLTLKIFSPFLSPLCVAKLSPSDSPIPILPDMCIQMVNLTILLIFYGTFAGKGAPIAKTSSLLTSRIPISRSSRTSGCASRCSRISCLILAKLGRSSGFQFKHLAHRLRSAGEYLSSVAQFFS